MFIKVPKAIRPLYIQVLIAIAIAVVVGLVWPDVGRAMKPLGDGFISLLKILIGPIIFCTVVLGLGQIRDVGRLGRVVLKAFIYFEIMSTVALIIGMVVANVFEPGMGMHATGALDHATTVSVAKFADGAAKGTGFADFILALIPKTFVSAFAEGEILQVLLLACLFGCAAIFLGNKSDRAMELVADLQRIFFKMLSFIMKLSPLGAFGAMAYTVGTHGSSTLLSLSKLVFLVYGASIFFVFIVLGGVAAMFGFSIFKILRLIKEELLLVLGTSSAEVALPRLLDKLERAGCEKSVVGLVLPIGYSFNTDGTAIYMSMAVVFISQATDTPLSILQQLSLLGILLLTSKGGAAVSGAGFVKLAATLQSVKTLPMSGLGILIGVDRFMSEARSLTNMIGNTVATLVIAKWEGAFDQKKFDHYLLDPTLRDEPAIEDAASPVAVTPPTIQPVPGH